MNFSDVLKDMCGVEDLEFILVVEGMGYELELDYVDQGVVYCKCEDLEE
ncbi:MAG: hypothetical protein IJH65_04435 [Methanobrevibacter sp.]|nr:hypothetical protein [Methanobrevibacter sp.]